jgi:cysteine desulfurase
MRDYLLEGLTTACPQVIVRGSLDERLPGNAHLTVPGCEGDVLLYLFDQHEIHVSTGSACQAGVPEASHVLIAMGVGASEARGALRFSMGYSVTKSDLDAVIRAFPSVVEKASSAGLAAG